MDGIELLQQVREVDSDAAVIVLTGAADVKTAIESLKLGAYDFIMKPVNVDELLIAAERALERRPAPDRAPRSTTACSSDRVERGDRSTGRRLSRAAVDLSGHAGSARAPRSTRATSAPRPTRAASTATRWPRRASTACRSPTCPTSPTACSCTTSARSASPTRILLKPGPLTPEEWKIDAARIRRSASA